VEILLWRGGTLVADQPSFPDFLIIHGDFTMSGGTLQKLATETTPSLFTFSGGKLHRFTKTDDGTISGMFDFEVESGGTIDFGSSVLDGSTGTFRLKDGAGIITAHPEGLSSTGAVGSVQTTFREFSAAADYEFRGASTGIFNTGTADNATPSFVRNLTINNNVGPVTLSKSVTISNPSTGTSRLVLKQGILITSATNLLTLDDNVEATGVDLFLPNEYNQGSFVDGPMRKIGNDVFIFPVGKTGTGLVPLGIDDITGTDQVFTAEYKRETPPDAANIASSTLITRLSKCEYWVLDREGTSTADVSFYWNTNNACDNGPYITEPSTVRAVHYNVSTNQWNTVSPGSGTGTNTSGSVTWENLNEFSPFALGTTSGIENPLPVVFDDMKVYEDNGVYIAWTNRTEKDVVEYLVERSTNGTDFEVVARQIPLGNDQQKASYQVQDLRAPAGFNYYRIRAVEQDGKFVYSSLLRIRIGIGVEGFQLYPNPVTGNQVAIRFSGLKPGHYQLEFINVLGQRLYTKNLINPGNLTQVISLPAFVRKGLYQVVLRGEGTHETRSLFVE
jgi:hypothetical protein